MTNYDNETDAERTARTTVILTRADLKSMTPQAIEQARQDGRLDSLMSGTQTPKEN